MTKSITTSSDVVIIGAGNLATNIAVALHNAGFRILQIFSRTMASAQTLADRVEAHATTDCSKIAAHDGYYIYCLKDDALTDVRLFSLPFDRGTHIHTSGTCPMSVLTEAGCRSCGVLYPLMTFTKSHIVDFSNIPLFVEGNNADSKQSVSALADRLSGQVIQIDSDKRARLHLAGVLTNNFINALLVVTERVMKESELDLQLLMPLVNETIRKASAGNALSQQTGPAVRGDEGTILAHRALLQSDHAALAVYDALTAYIKTNTK